ncbi:DNA polymerase III subunit alpha [Bacillus sp. FJAT-50079]|uniref:DNA polymerase III subunit alpha n=1 Tax=Bacillus sp. FJAT-50079 TaxID=2833577 RepID=UPI001BC8ECF5|nr:DNA polymerase III subunit alpha [Bacillus sp. FJAT-50079]MBS4208781.1 DNA polymerase III subunit alpha [Bacillus sp. FJAT-50079]
MDFAHLQISTAYSLLSSTISIPALVERAKQMDYSALAITDRNGLYGVLPFYKACIEAKIKPIIGLTADVETDETSIHPIILLARNDIAYKNLLKISSVIKTQPNEAISWKWLAAYSEGLIAITPGLEGEIEKKLLDEGVEAALHAAEKYKQLFQRDFYLAVQNHGHASEQIIEQVTHLAKEADIPIVATNDVKYLDHKDAFAYQCLTAIRDGAKLAEIEEMEQHENYNFKSKEEMADLFANMPEALENTLKIVDACNVAIKTNQELLPEYPLAEHQTTVGMLRELCLEGLTIRGIEADHVYMERLDYELSVINEMGFNDYFLIVWDFMKYARDHGILTGPGRGSAAGSLVAYLLHITDVDPIRYGLLFERFLNPERISMPDIDIDFPDHRRDEVIDYVVRKYGKQHVAQIITFGTLAARAALRDTARVFGLGTKEMDQLSKMIPSRLGIHLRQAYQESPKLQNFVSASEQNQKLFETALTLEGLPRHTSTHAAGVVIAGEPLVNLVPLQMGHDEGSYLTQFPMEDLEEIGLLKMDFLGLRNLSLLERIVKSIEINTGEKIDLKALPLSDEATFSLLKRGDTTGIFQLESEGMRKVLRELKPTEFEDIVAVNALYRPGPMEQIPDYIARKHGQKSIHYPHPDLKPVLEGTYGVIVYQEQIMQIASVMAGFSLGEADLLRRAVSKKKRDVLDREKTHFVSGALQKGYSEEIANEIYNLILRFANYGFNRSHAVAYSMISWQLAYLKATYPHAFTAALLTSVIGNEDKIAQYIAEAKQTGLNILPPSINQSHYPFIVEKAGIRFSLAAIKGIGVAGLKAILQIRKDKPFQDIFDFCLRVPSKVANRKVLEALVFAGAFDEFGQDRAVLLATLDVALDHAELMKPAQTGADLFVEEEMFQLRPKYIEVESHSLAEKLAFEKQATGVYLSAHPASSYEKYFRKMRTVPIMSLEEGQRNVAIGVYISQVRTIRTKKGEVMAFVTVSDATAEIDAVVFPNVYKRFHQLCQQGEIALINGHVESRDGNRQMIVQKLVKPVEIIDAQTLFVKVRAHLQNKDTLNQLQDILKEHKGDTPVVLHYEATKQTIQLGQRDWIDANITCLDKIANLLGNECVILK